MSTPDSPSPTNSSTPAQTIPVAHSSSLTTSSSREESPNLDDNLNNLTSETFCKIEAAFESFLCKNSDRLSLRPFQFFLSDAESPSKSLDGGPAFPVACPCFPMQADAAGPLARFPEDSADVLPNANKCQSTSAGCLISADAGPRERVQAVTLAMAVIVLDFFPANAPEEGTEPVVTADTAM
jgi:hypothetical protein